MALVVNNTGNRIREAAQEALKRTTKDKIGKILAEKRARDERAFKKATKVKRDRVEMSKKAHELFQMQLKSRQKKI